MAGRGLTESVLEDAALAWLAGLGYSVLHGPQIAAAEPAAERSDAGYHDVVLERRLRQAMAWSESLRSVALARLRRRHAGRSEVELVELLFGVRWPHRHRPE